MHTRRGVVVALPTQATAQPAFPSTPGWIRTNDLRIRSPLLYPLSYRGMADGPDDPIN